MKLKDYMISNGLSLNQMAKKTGLARLSIFRYYHEKTIPQYKIALKIIDATDGAVTLEDLGYEFKSQLSRRRAYLPKKKSRKKDSKE